MSYASGLATFKIEHEDYMFVKDKDDSKVPKINDKHHERKSIRRSPICKEFHANSDASRGPLMLVLREDPTVPDEIMHVIIAN